MPKSMTNTKKIEVKLAFMESESSMETDMTHKNNNIL